jgi:hypothetical protein
MSWTGSENRRRPQGTCSAHGTQSRPRFTPDLEPAHPRYSLPAGSRVEIAKDEASPVWRPYVTQKTLRFLSIEAGPLFLASYQGYLIRGPQEVITELT